MEYSNAVRVSRGHARARGARALQRFQQTAFFFVLLCAMVAIAMSATNSRAAGPTSQLLLPPSASDTARYAQSAHRPDPGVVRQRPVNVDFAQLSGNAGAMSVELFDGQQITVDLDRSESRRTDNYTWYGHVRGRNKSAVSMTVVHGQIAGSIDLGESGGRPQARYQVNSTGDGLHLLREIDANSFPPDHPPGAGDPLAPSFTRKSVFSAPDASTDDLPNVLSAVPAKATDSGATIDVMVVYSSQTAAAAGSAIDAQIQQAIDTANTVYANSGITTRLRLVHSEQANYSESGDYPTDLNWLSGNSAIATLRNTYAADLVSMLVESSQYCGYGWIGPATTYAFSVINRGCASGNYSFPHELGHNFGARHDTYVDPTSTPYAYGHGWVDCIEGWRDVMAYPTQCGGTRIPYFSNPGMTYGTPPDLLGTTTTADAARVHNQNASTVANFRLSSGAGGGTTCSYGLSPTSISAPATAGSGSFSVTAGSGCAWNSSPSASWLSITSGSGTSGAGTLSYSFSANAGAARSATISVGGQLFTVNQAAGCTYALSPSSASVDAAGGSGSTSLSTGSTCSWSASSSASWLTVSPSSGSAAGTISYTVVANTGVARRANLSIGGVTFVVSQGAAALSTAPVATLTPTTLSFGGQPTGQSSAAKTATLANSGSGTIDRSRTSTPEPGGSSANALFTPMKRLPEMLVRWPR